MSTPDQVKSVPTIQHPADILARARCLAASALVAFSGDDDNLRELADELAAGVRDALTPLERRAVDGASLDPAEMSRLSWQTVSAGVLLWSICRRDDPPESGFAPDAREVIDNVIEQPELTGDERLRSMTDLRAFARQSRAWAWGTREEQLVRSTGSTSIQQPVPDNANTVPVFADSNAPPREDLEVDGQPLREVDDGRLDELISINSERLRAVRWLLGESDWDAVALRV